MLNIFKIITKGTKATLANIVWVSFSDIFKNTSSKLVYSYHF